MAWNKKNTVNRGNETKYQFSMCVFYEDDKISLPQKLHNTSSVGRRPTKDLVHCNETNITWILSIRLLSQDRDGKGGRLILPSLILSLISLLINGI